MPVTKFLNRAVGIFWSVIAVVLWEYWIIVWVHTEKLLPQPQVV
jgi:hypothetical protein